MVYSKDEDQGTGHIAARLQATNEGRFLDTHIVHANMYWH